MRELPTENSATQKPIPQRVSIATKGYSTSVVIMDAKCSLMS